MDAPTSSKTRILFSVNDYNREGHGEDLRVSIGRALTTNVKRTVLQDIPRTPEHFMSTVLGEMLLSDVVVLDDSSSDVNNDTETLILLGISYALQRPCALLYVVNNSQDLPRINCSLTPNNFKRTFGSYLELVSEFLPSIEGWFAQDIHWPTRERNSRFIHAFSVFGADPVAALDLRRVINEFGHESGWSAMYCDQPNYSSSISDLSRAVCVPPFSIFCLTNNGDNSVFVGIGIAIGMGIPFLVLQSDTVTLPEILHKYNGVISYKSYSELVESLQSYTSAFLSNNVLNWNGSPFFHLLTYLEEHLSRVDTQDELETIESTIQAVVKAVRTPLAKPHMLLGDLYRRRHYYINPLDTSALIEAISHYRNALEIQPGFIGCTDKIVAVERNIQLIELLLEQKYYSIPRLIELIGSALSSEYYKFIREFLLVTVRQLAEDGEHAHALALLVAISQHDDSDEIKELMQSLLNTAPTAYIEAIHDAQEYIAQLENENSLLALNLADGQILTRRLFQDIETQKMSLLELNRQLESVQQERDELSENIEKNLGQYRSIIEKQKALQDKIKLSSQLTDERGVLVNFGSGWAVYIPLRGIPSVLRDRYNLMAVEGLVLVNDDRICDDSGIDVWLRPPEN